MPSITNAGKGAATLLVGAVGAGVSYAIKRGEPLVGRKDVYSVVVNRPLEELQPGPGKLAAPLERLTGHVLPVEPWPADRGPLAQRVTGAPAVEERT